MGSSSSSSSSSRAPPLCFSGVSSFMSSWSANAMSSRDKWSTIPAPSASPMTLTHVRKRSLRKQSWCVWPFIFKQPFVAFYCFESLSTVNSLCSSDIAAEDYLLTIKVYVEPIMFTSNVEVGSQGLCETFSDGEKVIDLSLNYLVFSFLFKNFSERK